MSRSRARCRAGAWPQRLPAQAPRGLSGSAGGQGCPAAPFPGRFYVWLLCPLWNPATICSLSSNLSLQVDQFLLHVLWGSVVRCKHIHNCCTFLLHSCFTSYEMCHLSAVTLGGPNSTLPDIRTASLGRHLHDTPFPPVHSRLPRASALKRILCRRRAPGSCGVSSRFPPAPPFPRRVRLSPLRWGLPAGATAATLASVFHVLWFCFCVQWLWFL